MAYRLRELILALYSILMWSALLCCATTVPRTSTARGTGSERRPSTDTAAQVTREQCPLCWQRWTCGKEAVVVAGHGCRALRQLLPAGSCASLEPHPLSMGSCLAVQLQRRIELGTLPALPYNKHPDAFQELFSSQNQRATHCKEYLPKDFSAVLEILGENFLGCRISLLNITFTCLRNLFICCNQDSNFGQLPAKDNLPLVHSLPPTSTCQHRAVRLQMAQKTRA